MRPRPPTTPSRIGHRRQEQDEDVEQRLLGRPDLARGGRRATFTPMPSSWSRPRRASRSCVAGGKPGVPMTISTPARPASCVARSSGLVGRVQERPLGRRLDEPDQRPGRCPGRRCLQGDGSPTCRSGSSSRRLAVATRALPSSGHAASGPPGPPAGRSSRPAAGRRRTTARPSEPSAWTRGRRELPRLRGGDARDAQRSSVSAARARSS